jgi:hypothetical protein
MVIIFQLIKIELINATSSITVVIVRIMHVLSVILGKHLKITISAMYKFKKVKIKLSGYMKNQV